MGNCANDRCALEALCAVEQPAMLPANWDSVIASHPMQGIGGPRFRRRTALPSPGYPYPRPRRSRQSLRVLRSPHWLFKPQPPASLRVRAGDLNGAWIPTTFPGRFLHESAARPRRPRCCPCSPSSKNLPDHPIPAPVLSPVCHPYALSIHSVSQITRLKGSL